MNEEERYKMRGYEFEVKGLDWRDYKDEINKALRAICGNNFEVIDINPKYFIVEALEESGLDAAEYSNSKAAYSKSAYRKPYAKYEFIDKLFQLIPKLNDVTLSASSYRVPPKMKTCYIEDNSNFELERLKKKNMRILDKQDLKRMYLEPMITYSGDHDKKYVYIGDTVFERNYDNDECYVSHKLGPTGSIYSTGFGNNLYLLYEINGENKTVYNNSRYCNTLDQENKFLEEKNLTKLDYKIIIDNKTYNVYKEYLKYRGKLTVYADNDYDILELCYTGYGYLRHKNGQMYEGEFIGGKYNGFGLLKTVENYKKLTLYEGHFCDDKYDGMGTLYDENGKKIYTGNWSYGIRQGIGTAYNSNGSILYIGNWKEDEYNGFGTLFNNDNSIKYSGYWYEGRTQEEENNYNSYNELMSECMD